jgi:hypothetical protein
VGRGGEVRLGFVGFARKLCRACRAWVPGLVLAGARLLARHGSSGVHAVRCEKVAVGAAPGQGKARALSSFWIFRAELVQRGLFEGSGLRTAYL